MGYDERGYISAEVGRDEKWQRRVSEDALDTLCRCMLSRPMNLVLLKNQISTRRLSVTPSVSRSPLSGSVTDPVANKLQGRCLLRYKPANSGTPDPPRGRGRS